MGKNKNKRRQNKQKKYSISRIIGYIFLALLVLAFIIKAGYETYINHILEEQGICTEAIVYDRHRVREGKMRTVSYYQFTWNGIIYSGKSYHDRKAEGKTWFNDKLITGDTITIVFLENDPSTNRSNSLVKKDCDCGKKQP